MTVKYFFHTFGCRVNQYETQALRERLLADGLSVATDDYGSADLVLINTCTVTEEADRDAFRLLRRVQKANPLARIAVTGCLASRAPEEILAVAPSAIVIGNEGKHNLPALLGCQILPAAPGMGLSISEFHGHSRAFLKIQDGCNMHCTYCIIPSIRPELWCKPLTGVLSEARALLERGYQEVVLCGVRLGRYLVEDSNGRRVDFVGLLERVLDLPGDFRVRLSSLEITDLTDRLIGLLVSSGGKLCPSFHLPLQSGSDAVLKRMQRWYTAGFYRRRIESLRGRARDFGLFTDVMVGFPGETEEEFGETVRFLEETGFSGLHVFRYSRRSGTPAADRTDQVPEPVVRVRSERMRELDRDLRVAFAGGSVGTERKVLIESPAGPGEWEATTDHFLKVRMNLPAAAPPSGADVLGDAALTPPRAAPRGLVQARLDGAEGAYGRAHAIDC